MLLKFEVQVVAPATFLLAVIAKSGAICYNSARVLLLEGNGAMIFGKKINRYYLKYAHWLIFCLLSLIFVD